MPGMFDWILGRLGGDPEAAGAAQASQAMGPNVLQYAQDVLSGKMAASGPVGQNAAYDPNKSFRENALRSDGLEAAMSMVGPMAIRAYHASPFLFDQFTLNNLRGGTGGLAQGRGLYFAQKEPVSLDYKRQFQERGGQWQAPENMSGTSPMPWVLDAAEKARDRFPWAEREPYQYIPTARDIAYEITDGLRMGDDLAHYRNFIKQGDWHPGTKYMYNAAIDAAKDWKYNPGPAHMYEVDIHADPNRLLGWDQPLRDQPNILDRISGINTVPGSGNAEMKTLLSQLPYESEGTALTGEEFYKWLARTFSGSKLDPAAAAAQALQDVGIPGNKYLDGFSRNYTRPLPGVPGPKQTYNYVISDPERTRIEILRKYGIVPPLAAGAAGGLLGNE